MNKDHIDRNSSKHLLLCFLTALYSTELAIGAAAGKEVGDYINYGHACHWDLFFDALGVIAGTAARLIIIRLICGHWKYNWI